jgi:hypothetical protein
MPGLNKGHTGRTDGSHGAMSSFTEKGGSPKKPGGSKSHPGPGNGSEGIVPEGAPLRPKGNV